jgi:pimeloyl-ACP methyl ester carboxylesterase
MEELHAGGAPRPRAGLEGIEERWIESEQGRIRYLTGGSGPALVLVHGLLGYSFSWRFNLPHFARRFTVFSPDLPGSGFSEYRPALDCSLSKTAETLQEFISALRIGECDMIASSHGGATALIWAAGAGAPPRARFRMVLVAPVNPWSSTRRWLIPLLGSPAGAALFRRGAPHLSFTHSYWLRRLYGDPRRLSPQTLAGYSLPLALPHGYERALSVLRTWRADLDLLERSLARVRVPTMLVWGTLDRAVLPRSAVTLRDALPDARLTWIEGAGHLPYEECPQEFNRIVDEFLA